MSLCHGFAVLICVPGERRVHLLQDTLLFGNDCRAVDICDCLRGGPSPTPRNCALFRNASFVDSWCQIDASANRMEHLEDLVLAFVRQQNLVGLNPQSQNELLLGAEQLRIFSESLLPCGARNEVCESAVWCQDGMIRIRREADLGVLQSVRSQEPVWSTIFDAVEVEQSPSNLDEDVSPFALLNVVQRADGLHVDEHGRAGRH